MLYGPRAQLAACNSRLYMPPAPHRPRPPSRARRLRCTPGCARRPPAGRL